jgi:hypothetical protein
MADKHNLVAYLATIGAIVLLALAAAAVCLFAKVDSEVNLARIIGGLAFISAAIAGLTGIAGTFKASGTRGSTGSTETGDVVVTGAKEGTTNA